MNHCRNSINKLYLKQIVYPWDDKITYYVTQDEVDTVLAQGHLPEVEISDYIFAENAPKIAILLTRDKHPDREKPDYSMPIATVEAIRLSGGHPYFMTYERVEEQLERIKPDGILLPGGDFALPEKWCLQHAAHPSEEIRTQAYICCLQYACNNRLPLLGICAGMQMLAGFSGAKIKLVNNHRGKIKTFAHPINISKNSLLFTLIGQLTSDVNTNHSEAISNEHLGDCIVSAWAPDGVIEAVELKKPWHKFVLGIQSHPEYFVKSGNEFAVKIFSSFIRSTCKDES